MDLKERMAFIEDIDNVLENSESTVGNIVHRLGWSKEHILNKVNPAACPIDHGHKMPVSSLNQHVETCSWIKDGYTKEEKEKAVPSSVFFYENATTVVTVMIDKDLQNQILRSGAQQFGTLQAVQSEFQDKNVPRTMDRAMSELTSQERFAIYDYAVAQGKAANVQNIFQLEDLHTMLDRKREVPQKEKSKLEILAEIRDYKRRRQSYRAKNVHITKKSYTEVMRNLIDNQMQILNPNEENDSNSNQASLDSSPQREVKTEIKEEDATDFSRESPKLYRDRSPEYRSSYNRSREHESRSFKKYSDDRDFSTSSRSYKRRRSRSRDKRESHSRSSKQDRHHHSKERSKSHKRSHKKHKHSHHRDSSED